MSLLQREPAPPRARRLKSREIPSKIAEKQELLFNGIRFR